MKQYLKSYQIVMRTVGPVFIGSGKEIGKKEYVFLNKKKAGILDIQRLYGGLSGMGKRAAFEDYMLGSNYMGLYKWLEKQNIKLADIQPFIKYRLDCGDAIEERNPNRLQILECMKDAYGKPYVPGSSLKGMFRTILLGADIMDNPGKFQRQKEILQRSSNTKSSRTYYLKHEIAGIEKKAYRILNKDRKNPDSAVNDCMQGFIVSDSEPLSEDMLVLCQKIELHTAGTEKKLPILRECIKPDTEIHFTLTIDTSVCKVTEASLLAAVDRFRQNYNQNFISSFAHANPLQSNYVLCGGGCGFVSKTVIYPLYGKAEGLQLTQKIFDNTEVPKSHKHVLDATFGVSPHILKCTRYREQTLQMGVCKIEKINPV